MRPFPSAAGAALVALALALVPSVSLSAPNALARRIDAYVQPYLDDGHLSGSLLVARGGTILYERSFGMANRELGVPNTAETRFCVASITKPMTVVIAVQLLNEGRLAARDSIAKWFPHFPMGDRITVEDLLQHRSGIPHRVTTHADETESVSASDMVAFAAKAKLDFEPGERSQYSSGGYAVLAAVLERASGKTYAELLEERVFRPAGMTHSVHADHRTIVPGRAVSYVFSPEGPVNAELMDYSFLVGAGSVFSTPRDLFRMMRTLLAGGYGQPASASLVRENGLSWSGRTNGFRSFLDYSMSDSLAVIFTGNMSTGAVEGISRDVPKLARGETVATPTRLAVQPVAVPVATMKRYEGSYRLPNGQTITLTVNEREKVMYSSDWLLIPTSETTFFSPQDYARVKVVLAEPGGEVERLDWMAGDQTWPCPRVTEQVGN
jgi:CubicO group peptidase (beta-lactamase class C family)